MMFMLILTVFLLLGSTDWLVGWLVSWCEFYPTRMLAYYYGFIRLFF
jgi:hypothetical protein